MIAFKNFILPIFAPKKPMVQAKLVARCGAYPMARWSLKSKLAQGQKCGKYFFVVDGINILFSNLQVRQNRTSLVSSPPCCPIVTRDNFYAIGAVDFQSSRIGIRGQLYLKFIRLKFVKLLIFIFWLSEPFLLNFSVTVCIRFQNILLHKVRVSVPWHRSWRVSCMGNGYHDLKYFTDSKM